MSAKLKLEELSERATPGQVVHEAICGGSNAVRWPPEDSIWAKHCEGLAAAVIAHVRPQIEAEARAVAVADCKLRIENKFRNAKYISDLDELAEAPAGHVVVSVEMLKFLNGECQHPVTGIWFGDDPNIPSLSPFWWRKYIREMLEAAKVRK